MKAAFIVVDMLNDFFEQSPVLTRQRPQLVASTNFLARAFRAEGLPVFWVRQEFAPDLHDAFLEMRDSETRLTIAGTSGCELLPALDDSPADPVIVKKRYSAFFGTDLDARLSLYRPEVLVIAGVNTHTGVRMTAIDAYQRDYEVVLAAECIASSDTEHHGITLRYLGSNIARILPSDDVLDLIEALPHATVSA